MKIQSIFTEMMIQSFQNFGDIFAIFFSGIYGILFKHLKVYGIPGTLLPGPHCLPRQKNDLQRKKYNFDRDHAWHCVGPYLSPTCLLLKVIRYDTSSQRVKVGHFFFQNSTY